MLLRISITTNWFGKTRYKVIKEEAVGMYQVVVLEGATEHPRSYIFHCGVAMLLRRSV